MPTRYTPDRRTIGNILSMTNPPVVVPDWQRNFSWTTSEVETFWQDLMRFDNQYPDDNVDDQEYFLGAIVIVDTNQGHLLLDGQQRIATSAILLSVIRDFLEKYNKDAAIRVSTRYLTDFDDALDAYTFKITLNRYDRDFFKREVLEHRSKGYEPPVTSYDSHQLIRKARNFFVKKFQENYDYINNPQDAHRWALRILKLITNHISVVAVMSDDEDNASNVFETLNDRGIGLSTPDLLRNLILRRANDNYLNEILDLWGEILEIESDAKLQDFFRHFWLSREGDVKSRSLYREIKTNVIDSNIESLSFSRTLRDSSRIYQDILNASFVGNERIAKLLSDIGELGAKVLYPPTLSLIEATDNHEMLEKYLKGFIVTYVRHSLIGKKENSYIENIMFSVAKRLRQNVSNDLYNEIVAFSPSDEQFKESFKTASVPRQASARYLLRELEQYLRTTEELDVAPPYRVHVEHIYPQTPLPENRLPEHNQYLNRIGNLTLLSARLNTSIRNGAYETKKPCYELSELSITRIISEKYSQWDESTIISRQVALSEHALSIWSY